MKIGILESREHDGTWGRMEWLNKNWLYHLKSMVRRDKVLDGSGREGRNKRQVARILAEKVSCVGLCD